MSGPTPRSVPPELEWAIQGAALCREAWAGGPSPARVVEVLPLALPECPGQLAQTGDLEKPLRWTTIPLCRAQSGGWGSWGDISQSMGGLVQGESLLKYHPWVLPLTACFSPITVVTAVINSGHQSLGAWQAGRIQGGHTGPCFSPCQPSLPLE